MFACWPMTTVYRNSCHHIIRFLHRQVTICIQNFLYRSRQLRTDTPHVGGMKSQKILPMRKRKEWMFSSSHHQRIRRVGGVWFCCRVCAWILQAHEKRMFDTSFSFLFSVFLLAPASPPWSSTSSSASQ